MRVGVPLGWHRAYMVLTFPAWPEGIEQCTKIYTSDEKEILIIGRAGFTDSAFSYIHFICIKYRKYFLHMLYIFLYVGEHSFRESRRLRYTLRRELFAVDLIFVAGMLCMGHSHGGGDGNSRFQRHPRGWASALFYMTNIGAG